MSREKTTSQALSGVLEMLDNVSACAENMLIAHAGLMTPEDVRNRRKIVEEARAFCDAHLRSDSEDDDDPAYDDDGNLRAGDS